MKCSVQTCAERDPKGLYKKASSGQIEDLTGAQDPYGQPLKPDVVVHTEELIVAQNVDSIMDKLNLIHLDKESNPRFIRVDRTASNFSSSSWFSTQDVVNAHAGAEMNLGPPDFNQCG